MAILKSRKKINKNKVSTGTVPIKNPNSSPIIAKMKSVWGVGRKWFFSILFPKPVPNKPPLPKLISDWFAW